MFHVSDASGTDKPAASRIIALTGGTTVPSARFRVGQYIRPLRELGVALDVAPATLGSYPPESRALRPLWAAASILSRVPAIIRSFRYDLTLLQRELLSTVQTLEGMTAAPRIFDIDDAIWLLPRGAFAGRIAGMCDRVIAGNAFLANYFSAHCRDVVILPTAVDTDRFFPVPRPESATVVVGWSGSSSGHSALVAIAPALRAAFAARRALRLRILSDRRLSLAGIPEDRVDFIQWSEGNEVDTIQSFDIGIMPLADGLWERGKCSYKMLLYMACGVPAIVSPVGMNAEVLALGSVGVAAGSVSDWTNAIVALADSPASRQVMGCEGRAIAESHFSVGAVTPQLAKALSYRRE